MTATPRVLTAIAFGLSAAALFAQEKPAPKPSTPSARDPFHKERGAPTTVPEFSDNLTTVTTVFEAYVLPAADAISLLTAAPDNPARYRRVVELVNAGKGRLEDVQASAAKPGVRGLIEAVDQFQFPFQFQPPVGDGAPVPSQYQMLIFGDRLEFEPILSTDGRACNLSFSYSAKNLQGVSELKTGGHSKPQPSTTTVNREVVTSVSLRVGEPALLGTRNQPPSTGADGSEIGLVFGRVLVSKERPESALPPAGPIGYGEQVVSFYSLDRKTARDLVTQDTKPGTAFKALQALLAKGDAKLEHITLLPSQTGMRSTLDENVITLDRSGTSGAGQGEARNASGKTPAAPATSLFLPKLGGQNLGLGIELQTDFSTSDASMRGAPLTADVNMILSWRADVGPLKGTPVLDLYPEIRVVESRKIQNSITCYLGLPTLLGTLNPPRDNGVNGRKDTGKAWLAFLQVTPVKP